MVTGALLAIALLVAAGSVALALAHHRRVAAPFAGEELDRAALLRVPLERRLDVVAGRALPGGWMRVLVDALRDAGDDDAARVAATNLALGELALQLDGSAAWPGAGLRVGISVTLLLAVAAFLLGVPFVAVPVCGIGGMGALGAVELGRRARAVASRQRERADELVALLVPDLVRQAGATGGRRRRRS